MAVLKPGDEPMHYDDGSHRWVDPLGGVPDEAWRASVHAHLAEHRRLFGHEPTVLPHRLRDRG